MLTKFVVDSYDAIVELSLWVLLVIGAAVGYFVGGIRDHEIAGMFIGAVVTFFNLAILLGAALTISQIRANVRDLEARYMQFVAKD